MEEKGKYNKEWKIKNIKKCILSETRKRINESSEEINDEIAEKIIEEVIFENESALLLDIKEITALAEEVFYAVRCSMDVLTPLTEDPDITEIMVNGHENIFIERNGTLERSNRCFDSRESLEEVIRRIAGSVHREINERSPILDARLEDGSRVNAVYRNIALGGPSLSIRKFPEKSFSMADLVEKDTLNIETAEFLELLVKAGYNIFVSGGTSSGKTTFLNVLSEFIPEDERVVVIEDSAELKLGTLENCVRMECRSANIQGKGEINMDTLIRTSLRMRPDRIIVGEVRGGECASMLQAMNTGHSGMSTGHANSIQGMLRRMEAMYLQKTQFPIEAVREQIAQGIDIIVHLARMKGKGRKVMEVAELVGVENNKFILNTLYNYKINAGLVATGNKIKNTAKLDFAGLELT